MAEKAEASPSASVKRRSPLSYAEAILKGLGSLTAAESSEIKFGPLPTADVSKEDDPKLSTVRSSPFPVFPTYPSNGESDFCRPASKNSDLKAVSPGKAQYKDGLLGASFGDVLTSSYYKTNAPPSRNSQSDDEFYKFCNLPSGQARTNDSSPRNIHSEDEFFECTYIPELHKTNGSQSRNKQSENEFFKRTSFPELYKTNDSPPRKKQSEHEFNRGYCRSSPTLPKMDFSLPSNIQLENDLLRSFRPFHSDLSTQVKELELYNARLAGRLHENYRMSEVFRGDCHRFMQESRDYHKESIKETRLEYKMAAVQLKADAEEQKKLLKEQRAKESCYLQGLQSLRWTHVTNATSGGATSNAERTLASDVLYTERPHSGNHILIAMPKEGGSAEDNKKIICENLNISELSLKVSKVRLRSNGKIMIETLTTEDKDNVYRALISNRVIRKKFVITVAKKRKPYFIILNVDPELDMQSVKKALVNQNDALTDYNISVKFSLPGRQGTNWVVAVDPSIFPVLERAKGVYLGWQWSRVSEYINVWQCFNCGKFGHTTKECVGEKICLRCGLKFGHEGECKLKCVNCTFSNQYHATTHDTCHSCIDRKCPNYIRQMGFVVRETDYGIQY